MTVARHLAAPRAAHWFFALAHVLTIAVGVAGLANDPAQSVAAVLGVGTFASRAWSTIFVVFGVVALGARLRGRLRLEAVAIAVIAGGFALWGVMVIAAKDSTSVQPAFGYLVIASIKTAWARTLFWWADADLVVVEGVRGQRDE